MPWGTSDRPFAIASPPLLTQERLTLTASISSSHAGLPKGHGPSASTKRSIALCGYPVTNRTNNFGGHAKTTLDIVAVAEHKNIARVFRSSRTEEMRKLAHD